MHYSTDITIGVARGGHGRAFVVPSLNFALPSKPVLACGWLANKV